MINVSLMNTIMEENRPNTLTQAPSLSSEDRQWPQTGPPSIANLTTSTDIFLFCTYFSTFKGETLSLSFLLLSSQESQFNANSIR